MKTEIIQLKIKRKQLASEAKDIRKEERRALSCGRWELGKARASGTGELDPNKWPEPAREAYRSYRSLHDHRTGVVRSAARSAHLAAAFLAGVAYRTVERRCRPGNEPSQRDVAANVRRFHPDRNVRNLPLTEVHGLVNAWIEAVEPNSLAAE